MKRFRQVRLDLEPTADILDFNTRMTAKLYLTRYESTASLLWRRIPNAEFKRRTI